jgi:molybdate transport system substrate-binding protein
MHTHRAVTAGIVAVLVLGCGAAGSPRADGDGDGVDGTVRVFAAAALTDAFTDIAAAFEREHPGATVELSFEASSTLASQVAEGAPADVLATADERTMSRAVDGGLVASPPREMARNSLVLAVPVGNPGGVGGLDDLADPDLFVGLCAAEAPCGALARDVLADAGVDPSVDTHETNVRSLLTKLTAGELDAGLVYRTDAEAAGDRVDVVPVSGLADRTIACNVAPLAGGDNPGGGAAFVEFVLRAEGRATLTAAGFAEP